MLRVLAMLWLSALVASAALLAVIVTAQAVLRTVRRGADDVARSAPAQPAQRALEQTAA